MRKYLMLAEVCFDWSRGEYSDQYVPDIFLGIEEFENDEIAESTAHLKLIKWVEDYNEKYCTSSLLYDSTVCVKQI